MQGILKAIGLDKINVGHCCFEFEEPLIIFPHKKYRFENNVVKEFNKGKWEVVCRLARIKVRCKYITDATYSTAVEQLNRVLNLKKQ